MANTIAQDIVRIATRFGLDPAAVLAVAMTEGGLIPGPYPYQVGDRNRGGSYGPFQLNWYGALPTFRSPYQAQEWAWSTPGIRYAIRKMAEAGARGLTGRQAIEAIVRNFERPADPNTQIARALAQYKNFKGKYGPGQIYKKQKSLHPLFGFLWNFAATLKHLVGSSLPNYKYVKPLVTPLTGHSEFWIRDAEGAPGKNGRYHAGKDWFAPAGSPVVAPVSGRVVESRSSNVTSGQVFGGTVKVQGNDGRVYVFRHVSPSVKAGTKVTAGQLIAKVSPWSGGAPHAHVEVWKSLSGGYNVSNMLDPVAVFSHRGWVDLAKQTRPPSYIGGAGPYAPSSKKSYPPGAPRPSPRPKNLGEMTIEEIFQILLGLLGQARGPMVNIPGAPDFSGLLEGLEPPFISPKQVRKRVNAAYKPIIEGLKLQQKLLNRQARQDIASLGSWYRQAMDQGMAASAAYDQALGDARASMQAGVNNALQAVGGEAFPGAYDLLQQSTANQAELEGIGAAQKAFQGNLQTLLGAQRNEAIAARQNQAAMQAAQLFAEINRVRGERASALLDSLMGAQSENYKNKLAYINTVAGLKQQEFNNALTAAQIKMQSMPSSADPIELFKTAIDIYATMAGLGAQQEDRALQREIDRTRLQREQLEVAKAIQELDPNAARIGTNDRVKLVNELDEVILTYVESGILDPTKIYRAVRSRLKAMGVDPNTREGRSILDSALSQYFVLNPITGFPISEFIPSAGDAPLPRYTTPTSQPKAPRQSSSAGSSGGRLISISPLAIP